MHDACAPLDDQVAQGDAWLASSLPMIVTSQTYLNGGAVFLTWDEGEVGGGPTGMIVLSPAAKGHGYTNDVHYDHSSLLRSLQEIFKVGPLLRNAANATDLSDLFKDPLDTSPSPSPTGR
jgi:hypothetical protein